METNAIRKVHFQKIRFVYFKGRLKSCTHKNIFVRNLQTRKKVVHKYVSQGYHKIKHILSRILQINQSQNLKSDLQ